MITLYEGVPGSGKSLFSAGQILDQLSLGHLVICNFPFSVPAKKKYRRGALVTCSNDELSVDFLRRWYRIWLKFRCGGEPREHQIYLVVDEAGTVFNPRDWQSSGRTAPKRSSMRLWKRTAISSALIPAVRQRAC